MGFFEIVIIAVVTLLAVGPERMPEAVRSVALTIGRFKRALQGARSEIEEHIGADDIRRQLRNEEIMADRQAHYGADDHGADDHGLAEPTTQVDNAHDTRSYHSTDTSS